VELLHDARAGRAAAAARVNRAPVHGALAVHEEVEAANAIAAAAARVGQAEEVAVATPYDQWHGHHVAGVAEAPRPHAVAPTVAATAAATATPAAAAWPIAAAATPTATRAARTAANAAAAAEATPPVRVIAAAAVPIVARRCCRVC